MNTINEDILVSYKDIPFSILRAGASEITPISEEEFNGLKGTLKHVEYDNVYTRRLYLQITGRCNFNCLHCFSAKDNSPLVNEMPYERICELLDMARDHGVLAGVITGGEPMVHPHIREIIRAFGDRGIKLEQFLTNGYLLRQDILDLFKEYDMSPIVYLSFDGIGKHDYMRGVKGAEEATLKAIELSVRNGFKTFVDIQVNRKTIDTIPETLRLLDRIGVDTAVLIKTTSTPRWKLNSGDDSYSFREYYDICLKILDEYASEDHRMSVNTWRFVNYNPKSKHHKYPFPYTRVKLNPEVEDNQCLCEDHNATVYVSAEGNVYPCLQMQGTLDAKGIRFGNVFEDGLHGILQKDSMLYKATHHTVREKLEQDSKCRNCEFSKLCNTGCPALSLIINGDIMARDDSICEFYESGIYEKALRLSGFGIRDTEE